MPGTAGLQSLRRALRKGWNAVQGSALPPGLGRRNWRLIMVIQLAWASFLSTSIMSTYYTKEIGLNNAQIYALQTTWAIVATLGTTVGGWLADRYGIRKVMLYGTALHLAQTVYFATCREFWQFEIALMMSGVFGALLGGSSDTLCTATLRRVPQMIDSEELFKQYQRTASRIRAAVGIVATLLGSALATNFGMRVPMMAQVIVNTVPLIAVWCTIEPREPAPHLRVHDVVKRMRVLLVDHSRIRWAVASYVTTGATSIAGFWLVQPRMLDLGINSDNFGWIYAGQMLCIAMLTWFIKPLQKAKPSVMWAWFAVTTGLGAVAAGINIGYAGIAIMLMGFSLWRACSAACLSTYLFKILGEDDVTRSIDISIVDAVQNLVFGIVGLGVGFVADGTNPEVAFLVIGGGCLTLNIVALIGMWRASRLP